MENNTDWQRPVTAEGKLDVRVGTEYWEGTHQRKMRIVAVDGEWAWVVSPACAKRQTVPFDELARLIYREGILWDVPGDKRKGRWVNLNTTPDGSRCLWPGGKDITSLSTNDPVWLPDAEPVATPEPVLPPRPAYPPAGYEYYTIDGVQQWHDFATPYEGEATRIDSRPVLGDARPYNCTSNTLDATYHPEYGKRRWLMVATPEPVRMDAPPPESLDAILVAIRQEFRRAIAKFPDPSHSMTALSEEHGELAKALLDEEPDRIYEEAVQVAVVAIRVALQGDPSIDALRAKRGLGPSGQWIEPTTDSEATK